MGKKLNRAPVYFVIAQVQFNHFMALDDYAPAIQDVFRKVGYPDIEQINLPVFDIIFGGPQGAQQQVKREIKQYSFFNIDRTEAFVLSNDRLSLQTTSYDVFESFSKKFLDGLKLVNDKLSLAYVSRTGLRYLDAVVHPPSEKPSKFVNAHLLGLTEKLSGSMSHSFSETVYNNEQITVTSRAMTVAGSLAIPPDLIGITLHFMPQFTSINGVHTVLDNDGSINQRKTFNIDTVGEQLTLIHQEISQTFKTMVTKEALESWK